jgi:sugar porter (SP) family MFS transporter
MRTPSNPPARCNHSTRTSGFVLAITAVAALGGLLFGYDTAVISGAIGFLQTHFSLNPVQTGWTASSALVGCVLGAAVAGLISDSMGRRRVLLFSAVMFLISALGTAIASSVTLFVVFRIIGGVGIGAASMSSPLYIAEIAPSRWRGRLVAVNQFAIVSGMLLIYFVNYEIARQGSDVWNQSTGWRWMFASGAIPSLVLLVLLIWVPETPRFLILKGRRSEACEVAARVEGDALGKQSIRAIEERQEDGQLLFGASTLRVLIIGIILAALQQVTGINVFLYYAPEIFKHVGNGTDAALLETILVGAVNLIFTILAMYTVDLVGRKRLLIGGSLGMGMCLCAIGTAAQRISSGIWLLLFVLGYIACFAVSVGPVTWIVLSEIFPTKLRGRAMAIATIALWTANFVVSQTFPMLDQNLLLVTHFHHSFPFFLYATFCLGEALLVWRMLPETKKRSLEEIAQLWIKIRVKEQ